MKKQKKSYLKLLLGTIFFLCLALIFQWEYTDSVNKNIDTKTFQETLNKKILHADQILENLKEIILSGNISNESLEPSDDIFTYIYRNDSLIFWNENELRMPILYSLLENHPTLLELQNNYCLHQAINVGEYQIVAIIKLKNKYSTPNEYLTNDFAIGFDMPSHIQIVCGNIDDETATFAPSGEYLFSLSTGNSNVPNKTFSILSIVCWIIFFSLLFLSVHYIYIFKEKEKASLLSFLISAIIYCVLLFICVWMNFPNIIFSQEIFSPVYYASSDLFSSLGHLLIFSIFFLSESIFLCLKTNNSKYEIPEKYYQAIALLFQAAYLASFFLICLLIRSLIYNSSFEINLSQPENINVFSITSIFIILSWLTSFVLLRYKGLIYMRKEEFFLRCSLKTNCILIAFIFTMCFLFKIECFIPISFFLLCFLLDYLFFKRAPLFSLSNITFLLLAFTLFIVIYSLKHNQLKTNEKNKILAENVESGTMLYRNFLAEILFEGLSEDISNNSLLADLLKNSENKDIEIPSYLTNTYFKGFWDNYDISFFLFDKDKATKTDIERDFFYKKLIDSSNQIKNSQFYFCANTKVKTFYLGIFSLQEKTLYIDLSSKQLSFSYSYPEPLLNMDEKTNLNAPISIANYENGQIKSKTGSFSFPDDVAWILNSKNDSFSFNSKGFTHFIYKKGKSDYIVINQKAINGFYVYITYWVYIFSFSFIIALLIYICFNVIRKNQRKTSISFLFKLQIAFLGLLIISFIATLTISTNYIIKQYKTEQSENLRNKTQYIQKYIQESFKENKNLKQENIMDFNFYLQDLSTIYETDINVYDNHGYLVASSQPVIFSKGLISDYMSPLPFFEKKNNFTQSEHIGKLTYLSAYTQLYNENSEFLGYINVPSFLSSDEIKKEIFNLLTVIINVYLIIIIIASFISILISKQLSKPLKEMEDNLKSVSLHGRNEKLEYNRNDEIGQLVKQYNLMVEKLEISAKKLAQSERESAWKQMARQVTHEINNPLTPMKLSIQQLQRMQQVDKKSFNEYFEKSSQMLIEQIENLSRIATSFSDFAKMPEAKQELVDISSKLESVISLFCNNKENVSINHLNFPKGIKILADKEQLTQVFNNLIKNAIQSIPEGKTGEVFINIEAIDNEVIISIKDDGTGIPMDIQEKMFGPNFTTKSSGMGLGLAIIKNILDNNNGKISFDTKINEGTTFYIKFPIAN